MSELKLYLETRIEALRRLLKSYYNNFGSQERMKVYSAELEICEVQLKVLEEQENA